MTRILLAAGVAFTFAVSAGAQYPTQTTPQPNPPAEQQKDKSKQAKKSGMTKGATDNVTLTGCLEKGDTAGTFVLASARMTEGGAKSPGSSSSSDPAAGHGTAAGTTGTGPARMGDMNMDVELVAASGVNLENHVGHQVEVTGTMSGKDKDKNKNKGTSGTTGSAAGETTTDTTSRQGQAQSDTARKDHRLNVQSLKHIAASCTR